MSRLKSSTRSIINTARYNKKHVTDKSVRTQLAGLVKDLRRKQGPEMGRRTYRGAVR